MKMISKHRRSSPQHFFCIASWYPSVHRLVLQWYPARYLTSYDTVLTLVVKKPSSLTSLSCVLVLILTSWTMLATGLAVPVLVLAYRTAVAGGSIWISGAVSTDTAFMEYIPIPIFFKPVTRRCWFVVPPFQFSSLNKFVGLVFGNHDWFHNRLQFVIFLQTRKVLLISLQLCFCFYIFSVLYWLCLFNSSD